MELELRVEPELIAAKAYNVKSKIGELQQAFEAMEQSVNKTRQYWIGEAGEAHRDYFERKKGQMEEMIRRWNEEVSDMFEISDTYEMAEKAILEAAQGLPADVIV